jgi:hypothetical protein
MCNVWQDIRVHTVIFTYENEQNTRVITTDGHAFVIDYEGDFSTRFKAQDQHPHCHISGKK